MSFQISVRDPPLALRPPPEEFGDTTITALGLSEGTLGDSFPSKGYHLKLTKQSKIPRLAEPIENIPVVETTQAMGLKFTKSRGPKKQRSLQSLFIPSFLQSPPPDVALPTTSSSDFASRARSYSAPRRPSIASISSIATTQPTAQGNRSGSPSEFFIDDDPFANISTPLVVAPPPKSPPPKAGKSGQRSPLSRAATAPAGSSFSILPPPSPNTKLVRPKSSGNGQARGAYTKPAFTSRPSLPSLYTLAQMNVVVPKKTRKGTVGARLPYEPWNMDPTEFSPQSMSPSAAPSSRRVSRVASVDDFTLSLGADAPDFTSILDLEGDEDEVEHYDNTSNHSMHDSMHYSTDAESSAPSLSYTPSESDISSFSLSRSSSLNMSSSSWSASDQRSRRTDADYASSSSSPGPIRDTHGATHNHYKFERYPDHDPLQSETDFDYYFWEASSEAALHSSEGKSASRSRSSSPPRNFGRTPYSSMYQTDELLNELVVEASLESVAENEGENFAPGSSAGTIKSGIHDVMRPDFSVVLEQPGSEKADEELVDGGGRDGGRSDGRRGGDDREYRRGEPGGRDDGIGGGMRGGGGGFNGQNSGGGSGGGRDRDGDDRRNRRPDIKAKISTPPESGDEDSTDDYGDASVTVPTGRQRVVQPVPKTHSGASTGTDDDVPLAQRIPTALRAQKTIRRQVRDERDQRRKERAEESASTARVRQHTSHPPDVVAPTQATPSRLFGFGRQRTKTMPSNASRPFAVDDLTQKLLGVQAATSSAAASMLQSRLPVGRDVTAHHDELGKRLLSVQPSGSPAIAKKSATRPSTADSASEDRGLQPKRSIRAPATHSPSAAQTPAEGSGRALGRSNTRSRRPEDGYHSSAPPTSFHVVSRPTADKSRSHRTSEEGARPNHSASRPSAEYENGQRSGSRPPIPRPAAEVLSNMATNPSPKVTLAQQRIFVGDKQRFNMVETSELTTAGEVVKMVESQSSLEKLGSGLGSWMLWEVSQDFGMERPIRDYELLADVESSWNKDKLVNIFVVKKTPLASILSRSAIPPSSPRNTGYIDWESKRGKWSKRYMELREHGLWLSKKDGKDETFLCALSNFDAYYVGKHKAPKPFVFAVKSTENISLFENASDYVHYFSCSQRDGETWMHAILLARSYVLYQERNVLFAGANGSASATSKPLSRSGTRKGPSSRPIQPLVDVSTSFAATQNPQTAVFEPGSMLAKRAEF